MNLIYLFSISLLTELTSILFETPPEIEQEPSSFTIIMPEARVRLSPQTEHLHVSIEASEEKLSHLEHVVLDHLIRMGQTPLTATWTQV